MKLPKEYVIVEIIPSHSKAYFGYIVQLQALKIKDDMIVDRLDLRLDESLINNYDLLVMTSYDKEMFKYTKKRNTILEDFKKFIGDDKLLIINNGYTEDYLEEIDNKKESVFKYMNMEYTDDAFDIMINKYNLIPSNHLVDLLYEALMFEKNEKTLVKKKNNKNI